ncbi:MAG: winged helix-turn-helix domain-containing protein [Candidatus Magasanikbacteria bacterium]
MLEHIFGSKTRVKLMQIFFRNSDKSFYVRELARMANLQLNTIRRELSNLETVGIVVVVETSADNEQKTGTERSKYYKLNGGNLLVPELRALLFKAQVLEEQEFINSLKKRIGQLNFFLLSGIFSNDEHSPTDMLIVGEIKENLLAKSVKEFEKVVSASIRYTVMTDKEFEERREIGDRFLYGILEAKHIVVVDNHRLK